MKTTQAGLARICGVSRSAIWYRVQKGHLRPDENGLLDVTRARRALQRRGSRIFVPYNERELLEIEKLKLQTYKLRKQIDEIDGNLVPIKKLEELLCLGSLEIRKIGISFIIGYHTLNQLKEMPYVQTSTSQIFRRSKNESSPVSRPGWSSSIPSM